MPVRDRHEDPPDDRPDNEPDGPPDEDVVAVLEAVPEFLPRYLALAEAADGDPGTAVAFEELADFAAELALSLERHRPVLARVMAGVEAVAQRSPEADEVIGWAFLDCLSPDDLRRLEPWLGPATRAVLEAMEVPDHGRAEGRP